MRFSTTPAAEPKELAPRCPLHNSILLCGVCQRCKAQAENRAKVGREAREAELTVTVGLSEDANSNAWNPHGSIEDRYLKWRPVCQGEIK